MNKLIGLSILVLGLSNIVSRTNVVFGIGGFLLSSYLHEYQGINIFNKYYFKSTSEISKRPEDSKSKRSEDSKSKRPKPVSRKKELVVIDNHRHIINGFYNHAVINNTTEYSYHPVYINGKRNLLDKYCENVIGVSIIDYAKSSSPNSITDDAIITDIIGIGGVDIFNRGEINNKKEN